MEKQIIEWKETIKTAVNSFLEKDIELLKLKVYEPAVSHRIAVYLERLFSGFHVDCEYNKYLNLPKAAPSGKEIRPDILVHKRSMDSNNILAIEIKKNRKSKRDERKLMILTDQNGKFKYKLGCFIYFPKNKPEYTWLVNGLKN